MTWQKNQFKKVNIFQFLTSSFSLWNLMRIFEWFMSVNHFFNYVSQKIPASGEQAFNLRRIKISLSLGTILTSCLENRSNFPACFHPGIQFSSMCVSESIWVDWNLELSNKNVSWELVSLSFSHLFDSFRTQTEYYFLYFSSFPKIWKKINDFIRLRNLNPNGSGINNPTFDNTNSQTGATFIWLNSILYSKGNLRISSPLFINSWTFFQVFFAKIKRGLLTITGVKKKVFLLTC